MSTLTIPTLQTTRLRLEPLSMEHASGMFEMWKHAAVQKYSGPAEDEHRVPINMPAQSQSDSDRLISFWLKAANDGWGFRWAILLNESDTFIGHIGFNSLTRCSEIAYHMNPDFWGKGYMSEAANATIAWQHKEGAAEIEAFIEPENAESIALAIRLGLRPTEEHSEGAQRYRMLLTL